MTDPGLDPLGDDHLPPMLLLGAMTSVLTALIGRVWLGSVVGLHAAAISAVHLLNVTYDPYVLPDSLAVTFQAAFMLSVIGYLKGPRFAPLTIAGMPAGSMFGTNLYFVLMALPLGILLPVGPQTPWALRYSARMGDRLGLGGRGQLAGWPNSLS